MRIGQRCLKSTGVVDVRRTSATWIIAGLMALGSGATAQQNGNPGERAASSVADALRQLNDQVRELQSTMAAMRADSIGSGPVVVCPSVSRMIAAPV